MKKALFPLLFSLAFASACDNTTKPTVACGSEDANQLVGKIVRENVEKDVLNTFDNDPTFNDEAFKNIGVTQIRQMLDSIKISLGDVRTAEKTDKSSKLQCEATLQLEIPASILQQAIDSNKNINGEAKNNADFFERDYRVQGAYHTKEISYSVQPTDDKSKTFAMLNQTIDVSTPIAKLVALALLKEPLNHLAQQAASEAAAQEAELAMLNQKQLNAQLLEVTERHKLALTRINDYWKTMPKAVQDKLQPTQIAWNNNHQKECDLEAKTEGEDELSQKISNLSCRTSRIEMRLEELKTQQEQISAELLKDAQRENQQANTRLKQAIGSLKPEIAEQLNQEYKVWARALPARCQQEDDPTHYKYLTCETKELNKKAKELEGYSI